MDCPCREKRHGGKVKLDEDEKSSNVDAGFAGARRAYRMRRREK